MAQVAQPMLINIIRPVIHLSAPVVLISDDEEPKPKCQCPSLHLQPTYVFEILIEKMLHSVTYTIEHHGDIAEMAEGDQRISNAHNHERIITASLEVLLRPRKALQNKLRR